MSKKEDKKVIAKNKAATHEYFIEDVYEAGISLFGTEVKSIRAGKVNLKDSYAYIKNGEVFVANMHVSPYEQGNIMNKDPLRHRKLLLNKKELVKLIRATKETGNTIIPIKMFINDKGLAKIEIGLARGKKMYDKRQSLKEKDDKREIDRIKKDKI